jgi:hypothetical protein
MLLWLGHGTEIPSQAGILTSGTDSVRANHTTGIPGKSTLLRAHFREFKLTGAGRVYIYNSLSLDSTS